MIAKKYRTEEKYLYVAACMKLAYDFMIKASGEASQLLYAADGDKFRLKAQDIISTYKSKLEDNMFSDGVGISNTHTYFDVFYGSLKSEPRSEIEEKVQKIAAKIAKETIRELSRELCEAKETENHISQDSDIVTACFFSQYEVRAYIHKHEYIILYETPNRKTADKINKYLEDNKDTDFYKRYTIDEIRELCEKIGEGNK